MWDELAKNGRMEEKEYFVMRLLDFGMRFLNSEMRCLNYGMR